MALALCRRAHHPPLGLGMGVVCPCLSRDRPSSVCSGGLAGVPAWCILATAHPSPPSSGDGYTDSLLVFQTCLGFHHVDKTLPARLGPQL